MERLAELSSGSNRFPVLKADANFDKMFCGRKSKQAFNNLLCHELSRRWHALFYKFDPTHLRL